MQNMTYFFTQNMNPLELRGQWDYSETNKSDFIRFSFSKETKTIQNISFKTIL